ncbi:MAG: efflux RND transporter periplasmic adaptor subunit [Hymenobacteraceae bacterium]|nr:efflux RND transporter periplasmic adaptor subunit [Hymenobacteraceae bacterium]MDX5395984.1 efflux RND transporter periplasmic adaptor subunit [Hymenobacteraceae bacterium]MDX5442190.1 efflux RND transporter periplasmic adaptor subunit [Hymenobacteraceae bacterium]MDX5512047.1 efflux RND transporter periplasmic adaptor subunit [Hymenobacteraceae bacterium]
MDRIIEKKKWTKKKLSLIGGGAMVLSLAVYTMLFADHSSTLNVKTDRLTIGSVNAGSFQEFIAIDGSVEPKKTIFLDIIEGGRVEKIYTDDGRKVSKGDTLLKLSNTTLQLDFMNRETQYFDLLNERQTAEISLKKDQIATLNSLAEIEYNLKEAERKYKRNKTLIEEKVIPQEEFEQSKNEFEFLQKRKQLAERSVKQDAKLIEDRIRQLDESITRMRANIEMARRTLNNLYIIAPVDGQLSTLKAEVGESKGAGENIGQIDDLNGFKVKASIDQHYISRVYPGLKGEFDFSGKTYQLTIAKVFPEVQNGEFQVDMLFEEGAPEGIRRGQTLQIRLHLSGGAQAVLLPRGGFYQSTGGSWVFVLDKTGSVAEKRSIRLGRQNPNYYEVLDGLKPGEKVILSSYEGYGDVERLTLQ